MSPVQRGAWLCFERCAGLHPTGRPGCARPGRSLPPSPVERAKSDQVPFSLTPNRSAHTRACSMKSTPIDSIKAFASRR